MGVAVAVGVGASMLVGVGMGVAVTVGVGASVLVGVGMGVAVAVGVGASVLVGVGMGVAVTVGVGASVTDSAGVDAASGVGVLVGDVVAVGTGSSSHAARRAAVAAQIRTMHTTRRQAGGILSPTKRRVTVISYPLPSRAQSPQRPSHQVVFPVRFRR